MTTALAPDNPEPGWDVWARDPDLQRILDNDAGRWKLRRATVLALADGLAERIDRWLAATPKNRPGLMD